MARRLFERQGIRRRTGTLAAGDIFAVCTSEAGTVLADISASSGGSSIAGSTVTTADIAGLGPAALRFYGPSDGTDTLWLKSTADPALGLQKIEASTDERLDALEAGSVTGIPPTLLDAKGDLIAAAAADTAARLPVGANDTVLTADSATSTGLKWAAGGGGVSLADDNIWTGDNLFKSGRPWIDVRAYESLVVGSDWAAAFQAAFDDASDLGLTNAVGVGPTVRAPWNESGYNISTTLTWGPGHFSIEGDYERGTIINWTGAHTGTVIETPSLIHKRMSNINFRSGTPAIWLDIQGLTDWGGQLSHVSFNTLDLTNGVAGVRMGRTVNGHWDHLRFDNGKGDCILIEHGPTSPGCSFRISAFTVDFAAGASTAKSLIRYAPTDATSTLHIHLQDARVEAANNDFAAGGALVTVDTTAAGLVPCAIHLEDLTSQMGTQAAGTLAVVRLDPGGGGVAAQVVVDNCNFSGFTDVLGGTWPTNFPIPAMPTGSIVTRWSSGRSSSGATGLNVHQAQRLYASDGVVNKTKAGAVGDADFYQTPPDGTIAVDTTNTRLYFRSGGSWRLLDIGGLSATLADAKGDLLVGTAADVIARLAVGANGQFLEADSTQTAGVKWANPGIGGTNTLAGPGLWNVYPTSTAVTLASANIFRGSYVVVPVKTAISQARIRVSASSGNIGVAVYAADGLTRLLTTGAVACPAIGKADLAFTGSLDLDPGTYFVGWSADNTTAALHGITNGAQAFGGGQTGGTSHPPPATVTVDDDSTGAVPCIGLY